MQQTSVQREKEAPCFKCLEQEVTSHMGKRRDTKEGWLKQKMQATHEVKSDRSSDLRNWEGNKVKGEVEHRAGLEHSSDLVKGHSTGEKIVFSVNSTSSNG